MEYSKKEQTSFLNGEGLKAAFEAHGNQMQAIYDSLQKGKCSQGDGADGAVRTEDNGWLCSEHYEKLGRE